MRFRVLLAVGVVLSFNAMAGDGLVSQRFFGAVHPRFRTPWLSQIMMGCVVALREHTHLGTDALVSRLPPLGKKICLVLGHLTMLYVCYLVFKGAWEQTRINMDVLAPSTQLPMAVLHSAGVAFAACAGVVLLLDLWLLFTGHMGDADLVTVQESEDLAALNLPGSGAADTAKKH